MVQEDILEDVVEAIEDAVEETEVAVEVEVDKETLVVELEDEEVLREMVEEGTEEVVEVDHLEREIINPRTRRVSVIQTVKIVLFNIRNLINFQSTFGSSILKKTGAVRVSS